MEWLLIFVVVFGIAFVFLKKKKGLNYSPSKDSGLAGGGDKPSPETLLRWVEPPPKDATSKDGGLHHGLPPSEAKAQAKAAAMEINESKKTSLSGSHRIDEEDHTYQEEENYNDNYWIPVESTNRKVVAHLRLKYQKTNNLINEREFDVSGFSRGDKGYHIHGYCHKRKKNITLSSLGIVEAIDIETGEFIQNVTEYLEEKYRGTADFIQDSLFDDYGWALYPLIYLAASSGSVVKKERDVIAGFIKSIQKFSSLDDSWIDITLKNLYRPSKMEIRNWAKDAIKNGNDFSMIYETIGVLETMQKQENKEFWTFKKYIGKQSAESKTQENA